VTPLSFFYFSKYQSNWEECHTNSFDKPGFVSFAVSNLTAKQLNETNKKQGKLTPKEIEKNKDEIKVFGSFLEQLIQTQMFAVFEHVC
jgi:hypothetical protein